MKGNIFQQIQIRKPKRNKFNLSHEKKLSFNMGDLVPILWKPILPGDTFRVNSEIFMRLAPMLAPIMHRVNVTTHSFFVPMRLVWNEAEDFLTGGREGTADPVIPYINHDDIPTIATVGSLADYLGLPVQNMAGSTQTIALSAMPFRAYQLIWNEYYRDNNLTEPLDIPIEGNQITDPTEITTLTTLRKRAWEKDYFTSALPWPQRGPEMLLPMQARVTYGRYTDGTTDPDMAGSIQVDAASNIVLDSRTGFGLEGGYLEGSNASTTINDLRYALSIQKWLESNARGGARYIEQILHHFGVVSSDARLQRPEYLGGSAQPVRISEVLNTTSITGEEPQGNMAGHGISAGQTNGFTKTFEEHGFIFTLMSVLPRTGYMDGIEKEWLKQDRFEYAWPELAHLGEEIIQNPEVYFNASQAAPSESQFGYQSRFSDYKYAQDTVHGDFRTSLEFWHMARQFTAAPPLNEDFVTSDPTHRIFAVTDPDVHKLYCQVFHKIDAIRPLPYFGTPTL